MGALPCTPWASRWSQPRTTWRRLGLELAYLDGAVTAVWPPAGLGLASLFLCGIRLWPGIVICDLLLADFSTPIGTVLGQTAGNTLALVVAALLLRRLTAGRGGLVRTVDVLAFVACAVAAATVSVSDDGVGGADSNVGSGLRGLAARVEALTAASTWTARPSGAPASAETPVT